MTKILIAANTDKAYAISTSQESKQHLYVLANNLAIPSPTSKAGIKRLEILHDKYIKKWFGKNKSPEQIAKEIAELLEVRSQGEIILAGYDKGIDLQRISTITSNITKQQIKGHSQDGIEILPTLSNQPLDHIIEFYHANKNSTVQIGITGKDNTITLYAPNTTFDIVPNHYSDKNKVSEFKQALNNKHHKKLLQHLESKDVKKAQKVLDALCQEDYCAIDRAVFHIKKTIFKPTIHIPKNLPEEKYTGVNKDTHPLIINVRTNNYEEKQEIAELISREYGNVPCEALMTIPSVILTTDVKEAKSIEDRLSNLPE
jgi:hypothetical protein